MVNFWESIFLAEQLLSSQRRAVVLDENGKSRVLAYSLSHTKHIMLSQPNIQTAIVTSLIKSAFPGITMRCKTTTDVTDVLR